MNNKNLIPCKMCRIAPKIYIMKVIVFFLFLGVFCSFPRFHVFAAEKNQWQLNEAANLPDWMSITGEHRTRYETINKQFRRGSTGSDQVLSLRTLVKAEFRFNKNFQINLELQDSRAELADVGSRMNSTIVNAAELLEANIVWKTDDLFMEGSQSVFRGGRLTMDIGDRRFIARNRFRNTIQAYTGVDWDWKSKDGSEVRAIFTLPVNREPSTAAELLKNDASFDKESFNQILWGLFYASPELLGGIKGEVYWFGLHEKDDINLTTRNREVYTPGFRIHRPRGKGQFDYELESMFQFGTVRATTATSDVTDLELFAYFHHAEAGYTFATAWSPRLYLEYDYASGDSDPNDNSSNRFERQYGPNVPEFGPTSIYTSFVRSNISSPGIRLQVRPNSNLFAYLSYRAFWLASNTDGWRGASQLRDTSGNSGSFLGHQLFLRTKWKAHDNIKFEGGLAYRIDGSFQKNVSDSPRQGNSVYTYLSTTFGF